MNFYGHLIGFFLDFDNFTGTERDCILSHYTDNKAKIDFNNKYKTNTLGQIKIEY